MKKSNRDRLLRLAKWLETRATQIRAYVKEQTPRRGPRKVA